MVFLAALIFSFLGHYALIERGASYARTQPKPAYIPVEIALVTPVEEKVEPPPPPPAAKTVNLEKVIPPAKKAPPPPNIEPEPKMVEPQEPPPVPVFGVTMESVVDASSDTALAVRVGNTLSKEPDETFTEPTKVKPYQVVSRFDVEQMPKTKRRCTTDYPAEARHLGIEGKVILKVEVLGDGTVGDVSVLEGPGYGLNRASVLAMKKCAFEPGIQGGKPITTSIRFTIRWELDDY